VGGRSRRRGRIPLERRASMTKKITRGRGRADNSSSYCVVVRSCGEISGSVRAIRAAPVVQ
jgi:hypothetical protein